MSAVVDTGPLLVFAKLQRLYVLGNLYQTVLIPPAVYAEAVTVGLERGYPDAVHLQAFLATHAWAVVPQVIIPAAPAGAMLGRGEMEAIALAQVQGALLLIDDSDARRTAEALGVATLGTLGVLVQAFRQGLLPAPELSEILTTIENRADIWIRPDLCARVRQTLLGT